MEKYKRISLDERMEIARMNQEGYSIRKIALRLGRSPTAIHRELQLHSANGSYDPQYAHEQFLQAQHNKGRGSKISSKSDLMNDIRDLLLSGKSPAQVCAILEHRSGVDTVSVNTIYRAIRAGEIPDVNMETIRPKTIKMFSNGCLIVPQHIRENLGLLDGDSFTLEVTDTMDLVFRKVKNEE